MSAWCRWPAAGCGVWVTSRHRPASGPIRTSRPLAVVEVTTSGHGKHTCSHIGSPNSYLLFGHFWLCRLVMTSGRQRPDGGCPLKILPTMSRSQPSSARWRIAGRETTKKKKTRTNEQTNKRTKSNEQTSKRTNRQTHKQRNKHTLLRMKSSKWYVNKRVTDEDRCHLKTVCHLTRMCSLLDFVCLLFEEGKHKDEIRPFASRVLLVQRVKAMGGIVVRRTGCGRPKLEETLIGIMMW